MENKTAEGILPERKPPVWINRHFALLWAGGSISVFGDGIFNTLLIVWISVSLAAHQSWAPLAIGGVSLAMLLPVLLFGPIAGVFVDRWDKRRTMLWMDALRATLFLILLAITESSFLLPGSHISVLGELGAIYTIVFLSNLCSQLFGPARTALISDLVPDAHRSQATSLSQISRSLVMLLAPALAPIIFLILGAQVALLFNAISFLCSFVLLLAIRVPKAASSSEPGKPPHFWHEFIDGISFSFRNRFLQAIIITAGLLMFGASALNTLNVFFALENLHVQIGLFGLLETAQGVGAILGSVLGVMFTRRLGLVRTIVLSLFIAGLGVVVYSRLTNFIPALCISVIIGALAAALDVASMPLLLRITPRSYIGRTMAALGPFSGMMEISGSFLAGYLASDLLLHLHLQVLGTTFGAIDTIFAAAGVIIIASALYALVRMGLNDPEPMQEGDAIPSTANEPAQSRFL